MIFPIVYASFGSPAAASAMFVGNEVPSSKRIADPRSKSAPTKSGIFAFACSSLFSAAVGYAWLFSIPSGPMCVTMMNPPA